MNDLNAQNIKALAAHQRTEKGGGRYGYNTINDNDVDAEGEKVDCLILFDNREKIAYGLDPHTGDSTPHAEILESLPPENAKVYVRDLIRAIEHPNPDAWPAGGVHTFAVWTDFDAAPDKAGKGGSVIGTAPNPVEPGPEVHAQPVAAAR